MKYMIELTVLDKGALLTVVQSRHAKRPTSEARALARNYAGNRGLTPREVPGGFWPMHDERGITRAQIAIRTLRNR